MEYRKKATTLMKRHPFIGDIHTIKEGNPAAVLKIAIPDNHLHLCIHEGAGIIEDPNGKYGLNTGAWLCGPLTTVKQLSLPPKSRTTVIKIKPWLIPAIADTPLSELCDRNISIPDIVNRYQQERFFAFSNTEEQLVWLLELLQKKSHLHSPNPNILNAISRIETMAGLVSVRDVANYVHYSIRNLERRFKAATGITVKKFINHTRVRAAIRLLLQGYSLLEVTYNCEYFDQAHFIASFKQTAGITPGQFAKISDLGQFYLR